MSKVYSKDEIARFETGGTMKAGDEILAIHRTQERIGKLNMLTPKQALGIRYSIGCVALEITQRCNLDCSACYLSEYSENTKDVPIEELFHRIDQIYYHYGPRTDVQITGGDPTVRDEKELLEIIRYIRSKKMRPTLMTNGIKATRRLLEKMAKAGLNDIAIHVDTTQERKGYSTEADLNKVRLEYIKRCEGLPISVIFNTTVTHENFHEIPDLAKFFLKNSHVVNFASFQLQADTGRGVLSKRAGIISNETVQNQIRKGVEANLCFDSLQVGHLECNSQSTSLVVNEKVYDIFDNHKVIAGLIKETADVELDRTSYSRTIRNWLKWIFKNPVLASRGMGFLIDKLWRMKFDLIKSRGKFNKITFFLHNFMDADHLECDRIDSCSFMVMTSEGPISMCMHNAKRDEYILKPVKIKDKGVWNPMDGKFYIEVPVIEMPNVSVTAQKRETKEKRENLIRERQESRRRDFGHRDVQI